MSHDHTVVDTDDLAVESMAAVAVEFTLSEATLVIARSAVPGLPCHRPVVIRLSQMRWFPRRMRGTVEEHEQEAA